MTGTSSRMRPEAAKVIFEPAFVIRVGGDHRPVMASPSGPGAACAVATGLAGRAGCLGWGVLSGGRRASSRGTVAVSPVRRVSRPAGR